MAILEQFRLDGRIALVTGATSGLGAAIAVALAEAGADVICHDRDAAPAETMTRIEALRRRTAAVLGDLADASVPARLVADAEAALGPISILVNNAGTIYRAPAAEHADAEWDRVIAINLSSPFRLAREVGRRLIARGAPGKVVNTASLLAFQGGILVPSYAASKGGLAQLTKALANEWAPHRINVNAIAPGYMATANTAPLQRDEVRNRQILERIPAGRWGQPTDLAGAVVFLSSNASDYVTGHVLVVDGGWLAR
ncbi:MAG: SDR family oxidoreductase [Vicinamibacterales bacterium]|jgi:2-deoxy-D-gluconate 3-dehydrogenase|nr:SDR family oxidoreductase [Vicinamibacterales bacterium]